MKSAIALALISLVASAQAVVLPRTTCTKCAGFTLTASGGVSGPVGQLSDGQNRVGPGYTSSNAAKYTLNCSGGITDGNGRGCILTPPTTQFQCDTGASPTTGFSIGSNGQLLYGGSGTFWACPTGDNGSYNIYTKSIQAKCVTITLTTKGCTAPPPATCGYSSITPNGANYEFPHLIVPVDSANPNKAYGTVYSPIISKTVSTIFNFDVRPAFSGKKCSLVFVFPNPPSSTSSYTFSGAGNFQVKQLKSVATTGTTYANQPAVSTNYGTFKLTPGNSYTIATFTCPAGQAVSYEFSTTDSSLTYFQDYNPPPIGAYITSC